MTGRPRFWVLLEAQPEALAEEEEGRAPPAVRLRRVLKSLGRRFGYKALRFAQMTPKEVDDHEGR